MFVRRCRYFQQIRCSRKEYSKTRSTDCLEREGRRDCEPDDPLQETDEVETVDYRQSDVCGREFSAGDLDDQSEGENNCEEEQCRPIEANGSPSVGGEQQVESSGIIVEIREEFRGAGTLSPSTVELRYG